MWDKRGKEVWVGGVGAGGGVLFLVLGLEGEGGLVVCPPPPPPPQGGGGPRARPRGLFGPPWRRVGLTIFAAAVRLQ